VVSQQVRPVAEGHHAPGHVALDHVQRALLPAHAEPLALAEGHELCRRDLAELPARGVDDSGRSRFQSLGQERFPLAAPDLACLLADSPVRPLDYAFVLNLGQASHAVTDFEPLYRGAEGARTAFPVAGSRLRQPPFDLPCWETRPGAPPALVIRVFPEGERELRIQEFLEAPLSLRQGPPLRQMLLGIGDPPSWSLVTQVHHAASDLIGTLLFVQRQLRMARGLDTMPPRPQIVAPELLRHGALHPLLRILRDQRQHGREVLVAEAALAVDLHHQRLHVDIGGRQAGSGEQPGRAGERGARGAAAAVGAGATAMVRSGIRAMRGASASTSHHATCSSGIVIVPAVPGTIATR